MRAKLIRWAVAGVLVACQAPVFAADQAGEMVKVLGRASAASVDGDIRTLADGTPVNPGDTVVTSINSWARMKMTDGAFVVLRPNTRFQIAEYNYEDDPAKSRSIFNLVRGGFRAVTGLIGQRNHSAVSFRTAIATIGIRGTDLEAIDCTDGCPDLGTEVEPGVYFTVHEGEIDVNGNKFGQGSSSCAVIGSGQCTELDWKKIGCPTCGQ